jgi:hypothetical protein
MAFQLSAGINVSEIDLTTAVPSVATSIGAFAGPFQWGPANTIITISNENELVSVFGPPNANSIAAGGNLYEYWFSASNFLNYSNNLKVVRAANNSSSLNASANAAGAILIENEDDYFQNHTTANTTNGPVVAKYPGNKGNALRFSICPSATAFSSNLTSTDGTYVSTSTSNTVIAVTGGTPVANLYVGDLVSFDAGASYVQTINVTASFINVAANTTVTAGAAILRKWQYADNFGVAPGTSAYTTAVQGTNDELHIVVVDQNGSFSPTSNNVLEKFAFASKASDAKDSSGNSNYYVNLLNNGSKYFWWTGHQPGATNWGSVARSTDFNILRVPFTASLTGGSVGNVSVANVTTAYSMFSNQDSVDVGLIISGPAGSTLSTTLISNIAESRKDCVLFLSPPKSACVSNPGSEVTSIITHRDSLTSTSYAFMDSGWKYQYDKYDDVYRWVPLNGDIAGLAARSDLIRDPWFSPAGLNRGQIKNVIKLAWNPSKTDRDNLYVKGINPVVSFQGEGTVLFGDKTMLSKPSAFDRINVRRLFIVLEKTVTRASRFSLFELNDQFTRAQFNALVEPYLREVQGRRGITDFRVVCDTTNNTPEVIDRNEFVGDIYIKPARSINFIQLNFVATRTGVSFEEVVGRF